MKVVRFASLTRLEPVAAVLGMPAYNKSGMCFQRQTYWNFYTCFYRLQHVSINTLNKQWLQNYLPCTRMQLVNCLNGHFAEMHGGWTIIVAGMLNNIFEIIISFSSGEIFWINSVKRSTNSLYVPEETTWLN